MPLSGLDHIRRLFGDHDRRCVGIAADDGRHDRGIDHTQAFEPLQPQPRIDDRHVVRSHLASADRVIQRVRPRADVLAQFFVAETGIGIDIPFPVWLQGRGLEYLPRQFHAGEQRVLVAPVGEETRVDARLFKRVGVRQADLAARMRAQHAYVAGIAVAEMQRAAVVVDHGDNEAQKIVGAAGFFYANMIKIYEGERALEGRAPDETYGSNEPTTKNMFRGLDRYTVGGTDLLLNTNAKLLELCMLDRSAGAVLSEFLLRTKHSGTVFSILPHP